ncbi:hypothetical protein AB4Y45_34060 [Paraburkholderia sp. EG287A]|uniref:hypothetical protein n=1 Tax=Paraburkholderia sp. EG287A TaxID=3237012 RepID=UPI0034D211DC
MMQKKILPFEPGTRGCPECHGHPETARLGPYLFEVSCSAHGEAESVRVVGNTLGNATRAWNDNAAWVAMGANVERVNARPTFWEPPKHSVQ